MSLALAQKIIAIKEKLDSKSNYYTINRISNKGGSCGLYYKVSWNKWLANFGEKKINQELALWLLGKTTAYSTTIPYRHWVESWLLYFQYNTLKVAENGPSAWAPALTWETKRHSWLLTSNQSNPSYYSHLKSEPSDVRSFSLSLPICNCAFRVNKINFLKDKN